MRVTRFTASTAVMVAFALLLTGCVNNATAAPGGSSSSAAVAKAAVVKDDAAAKLLPKEIVSAGKLTIGTDPTAVPNEFKDASGKPIGWEIELGAAMAKKLGLTAQYQVAQFDNILPGILGGKYDVGLSSFFDTKEREQKVDMVDYYKAGIQWVTLKGKTVNPDAACGLKVAVQNGTTQALSDLPAKSKACVDAGKSKIEQLGYDTQDEATAAVTLGRADAMTNDSPIMQYIVKQSHGKLALAGDFYSTFLYGMAIKKDRGTLAPALRAALQSLIKDGTYASILDTWGIKSGALASSSINGAKD